VNRRSARGKQCSDASLGRKHAECRRCHSCAQPPRSHLLSRGIVCPRTRTLDHLIEGVERGRACIVWIDRDKFHSTGSPDSCHKHQSVFVGPNGRATVADEDNDGRSRTGQRGQRMFPAAHTPEILEFDRRWCTAWRLHRHRLKFLWELLNDARRQHVCHRQDLREDVIEGLNVIPQLLFSRTTASFLVSVKCWPRRSATSFPASSG
jgi:hypothetical protein